MAHSIASSRLLRTAGPFLGLFFVLLLFSVHREVRSKFLSVDNFRTVAAQTVIVGLGALGMTLIIVSGGIDLSVGSSIALTSVVCADLLRSRCPPLIALMAAILVGGAIGLVNGMLLARLRLPPFIITLGTLGIVRGLARWLAQDQAVNPEETWVNMMGMTAPEPAWLIVSPGVWITIGLAIVVSMVLRTSAFGRSVVALGSNESASRLCGLPVDRIKMTVYMLAGLFFGLGGVIQYARLGQGDPTVASGAELDVIAAVVIGGGSLSGGEGSVLGSLIGALLMAFLRNGAQQMDWPAYVEQIIIGAVIVIAVTLDRARRRE